MKTQNDDFSKAVLTRAVQLALLAMFAAPGLAFAQDAAKTSSAADDDGEGDIKPLVCPTNYFEIGALGVSKGSPKFGEYTGLHRSGGYGVGNFSVSGGSGYCQTGGNLRWQIAGKNLGTTSREIGAKVSAQGKWTLGLSFDQLRHYTTTGYQTPLQGSQGGNAFTLPPSFGIISTAAPTVAGTPYGSQALTSAQLAAFRSRNVYNERQNTSFNAGYAFNGEWGVKFDFKHIDQSGAKLISAPTNIYAGGPGGYAYAAQGIFALMNPTKSKTDTFNLALNWIGDKAYASAEYYVSLFRDAYRGLTFPNPFTNTAGTVTGTLLTEPFPVNALSTAPDNQLHQINFSGGYIFSPATKLTGGLSYGINKQNSSYDGTYNTMPNTAPGLPANSLNGKVVTKHADFRLTHRFMPALNFNVGYKYNERNNSTPVNVYNFLAINTNNATGVPMSVTNAPMSNKRHQFDAALDYRIDKLQKLRFGYDYDRIERWCGSSLANNAQGANAAYYTTASCAQVPRNAENNFNVGYKLSLLGNVDFNAGYAYSDRKATVNPSFYNPMQIIAQGYENYGWLAAFQASRRQDLFKTGVTWQATNKISLGVNGRYTKDRYYDSALGVQNGKSASLNFDADFAASEHFSYGAYVSWQRRSRDLLSASDRNLVAPPVNLWSNTLTDRDTAFGLRGKQKLLGSKLELVEDLSYSFGKTSYYTTLLQNIAPAVGNSGATPDITSRLLQLRLTGTYALSKTSSLTAGYIYQRLKSNDYFYNAYQYGFTPTAMMPSGLSEPTYRTQAVYVVYRYLFQ